MAVPKKKMSKSKKNSRKSYWKSKASSESLKAISLAKSVFSENSRSTSYFQSKNLNLEK